MLFNRNFFKKGPPRIARFHMDHDDTPTNLANHLLSYLAPYIHRDIVIVCIGTDRSTGDSLGPLIGTKLEESKLKHFFVYGTLEHPVHAVNLEDRMNEIYQKHKRSFVVGIDACLGRLNSVGQITVADGPVKPGAAVKKQLPEVGNIHLTGIVNIGGIMEYFVLQNTRLAVVMKMATVISTSIRMVDELLAKELAMRSNLQSLPPKITFHTKEL